MPAGRAAPTEDRGSGLLWQRRPSGPRQSSWLRVPTKRNRGVPLERDAGRGRKREGVTGPGDEHREARRLLTPQQPAWDTDRPLCVPPASKAGSGAGRLVPLCPCRGKQDLEQASPRGEEAPRQNRGAAQRGDERAGGESEMRPSSRCEGGERERRAPPPLAPAPKRCPTRRPPPGTALSRGQEAGRNGSEGQGD